MFAGDASHDDYVDDPHALADELPRARGTLRNINLQRADRVTMIDCLEAPTTFLDRDLGLGHRGRAENRAGGHGRRTESRPK